MVSSVSWITMNISCNPHKDCFYEVRKSRLKFPSIVDPFSSLINSVSFCNRCFSFVLFLVALFIISHMKRSIPH